MMRVKPVYLIAVLGLMLAIASAWLLNEKGRAQPPLFKPAANPYANGIYANGIVESLQAQGADIAVNPEVSAPVVRVLVREGESVRAGQPLIQLDQTLQQASADQFEAQAAAAKGQLAELKAEPRPETLAVSSAQVDNAAAALKSAADSHAKLERAYQLDPRSVSKDQLDTARNAEAIAATALKVARRNYALTRAGAWSYDIANQRRQAEAAEKASLAAHVLLGKYTLRAPSDGVVLAVTATVGNLAGPQGVYDPRTQAAMPAVTVGTPQTRLAVRAYVDEILAPRLPAPGRIVAQMTVRGSDRKIPLRFERIQPYVSPKIELSNQRQERVDVRVLPVIFSFAPPSDMTIYPGQLVDIYIGAAK
jgi:HlyD family secretion protein